MTSDDFFVASFAVASLSLVASAIASLLHVRSLSIELGQMRVNLERTHDKLARLEQRDSLIVEALSQLAEIQRIHYDRSATPR